MHTATALRAAPQTPLFPDDTAPAPVLRPTAPAAPRGHVCGECGAALVRAYGKHNMFCTRTCQLAFGNRMTVRGRVLTPLAMADRLTRSGTRGDPDARRAAIEAGRQYRQLIDQWAREDREAGRMTAVEYVARKHRLGYVR